MRAHIADFPACPHCADFSKGAPCVAANFGYPERCLRRHASFAGRNTLVLIAVVIIFVIAGLFSCAQAAEYAAPNTEGWYQSLKQPDYPKVGCCGWGDAYYADKVAECPPNSGSECALIAIITDTRPDTMTLSDGRVLTRPHVAPGTRVPVPRSKVRKVPSENPTDHNILFVSFTEFGAGVFCWEPASGA